MSERDEILAEIRRTAAENGGSPLGSQRFYAETGIKKSAWLGKYWARWSDAIAEAGLEPNVLQTAIPENVLLDRLTLLARELGHIPVNAELRIRARNDASFPSESTFSLRFSGKTQLVERLTTYCEEMGYADVLAMCREADSRRPGRRRTLSELASTIGFVYLLKYGRHYKIGKSNAVGRRERELAIQLPEKARLVHSIKTDDPEGIEQYWHRRFASKRGNGEWFDLTADDIAVFTRRKVM